MALPRSVIPKTRNVSDKSCKENQKKCFMISNVFPKNLAVYEIIWKYMVEVGKPRMTVYNVAHALCTLATEGCRRHTYNNI